MNTNIGLKCEGFISIRKINRKGEVTFESVFQNTITDSMFNNGFTIPSATDAAIKAKFILGTDTTPIATNATVLENQFPISTVATITFDVQVEATTLPDGLTLVQGATLDDDYFQVYNEHLFAFDQANGSWSSIGLQRTTTPFNLLCGTLIKDASGNPVTVTKTSDEQLEVGYAVRFYRPRFTQNIQGPFTIGADNAVYFYSQVFFPCIPANFTLGVTDVTDPSNYDSSGRMTYQSATTFGPDAFTNFYINSTNASTLYIPNMLLLGGYGSAITSGYSGNITTVAPDPSVDRSYWQGSTRSAYGVPASLASRQTTSAVTLSLQTLPLRC